MNTIAPFDGFPSEMEAALEQIHSLREDEMPADGLVRDICLILVGEKTCTDFGLPFCPDDGHHLMNEELVAPFLTLGLFVDATAHRQFGASSNHERLRFEVYASEDAFSEYLKMKKTHSAHIANADKYGIPRDAAEAFVENTGTDDSGVLPGITILDDLVTSGDVSREDARELVFARYIPVPTPDGVRDRLKLSKRRGRVLDEMVNQSGFTILEDAVRRLRQKFSFEEQTRVLDNRPEWSP